MHPQPPASPSPETTAAMVAAIARELPELRAALAACRGDHLAEPRVTAALLAHLLLSSPALLRNLLIDTATRPRRLPVPAVNGSAPEAVDSP